MQINRKEIVKAFLKMVAFGDVKAGYEKFISPKFIHHNQYFKGDRESLLQAMAEAHLSSPNKSMDIKHIYEDGSTVITHSLVTKNDMDVAVVHIFRFENDQIVELWDLGQVLDPQSPNENGAF